MRDRLSCRLAEIGLVLLAPIMLATASPVGGQPYPSSSMVRIVVPSAAGTPPDIMGRIVASELSESEGWRVIVATLGTVTIRRPRHVVYRQSPSGYGL